MLKARTLTLAKLIAIPSLSATLAVAVGQVAGQTALAKGSRAKPTRGQCTVWANYKRPDLKITAVARRWDEIAASRGFPVDGTPHRGDIAVWDAYVGGAFSTGHVAYVTAVSRSNRISVSEFNWGARRERYGTRANVSAAGLRFIHRRR